MECILRAVRASVVLSVAIMLVGVLVASTPASAISELSGVTVDLTPPEMEEGENVHIVLIVHNSNSQPLNITGIAIQANQGPIYVHVAQRGAFNGSENYVPAGGSAEIDLDGKAPKLVGTFRIIIGISGFLGDGENLSSGGFVASTYVNPAQSPTLFGFDPILLITVFASIFVIAALAVFLLKRKSWS